MTTAIEKVTICDAEILCIRGPDGRGYVVVRRVCEVLGLNDFGQQRKLKNASWACTCILQAHDASGRNQELFCLLIDCVPMWLTGINARKVAEEMRPMLERFQMEASGALWRWFNGGGEQPKALPDRRIEALERAVASLSGSHAIMLRSVDSLADDMRKVREHGDTISPENCKTMQALFKEVADWMLFANQAKTRRSALSALRADIMEKVGWRGAGCYDRTMPSQLWPTVRRLLEARKQAVRKAAGIQREDKQRTLFTTDPAPGRHPN